MPRGPSYAKIPAGTRRPLPAFFSGLGESQRTRLVPGRKHLSSGDILSTNLKPRGTRSTGNHVGTGAADRSGRRSLFSPSDSDNRKTSSETHTVTSHIQTKRKAEDWSLCVRKTHLIIGDSNLSRIPPFRTSDGQVDSFPGATFTHVVPLMENTRVETFILSFGINHRNRKYISPTKKQQDDAVCAVRR